MIVCKDEKDSYELIVNLNKNEPKKLIEDYVSEFYKTIRLGNSIDIYRFLQGLPQTNNTKVEKALSAKITRRFEVFILNVHETWTKNFLEKQETLLDKCEKKDAPMIYAIARFLENKIMPTTLKELEYTYKTKIPYMYEGKGYEVTLSEYSPIVSKSMKMHGFDTLININTNNLYSYVIGENYKESIIYLNPKIENMVDICGKVIEYSKENYVPMDITYQNFSTTLKNKELADALERTNKIEIKLDDRYVAHFLKFLIEFDEKTKILDESGKLPRAVEVYNKKIGVAQNLNDTQKKQAKTFSLHRTYFLQEATAHTVRDILSQMPEFTKPIAMDKYAYGRRFQQIEDLFATGLCLEDENEDKRKTMIFLQKYLLSDKYMFRNVNQLYDVFTKEVKHYMDKESFKGHLVAAFLNVARKLFLDCNEEEIIPIMLSNATRLCKLFDISKVTYAFQEKKRKDYRKAVELTNEKYTDVDKTIKERAEKLYVFDTFEYYPIVTDGETTGVYIAGYIHLPAIKDAFRTLLCVSNNRERDVKGIRRVVYKMYPITFTYQNRSKLPQILELIAKFSIDNNFIKQIETSHGYLGNLEIKDPTSPNAFGAFNGWDYMDITTWETAKNTYNEVQTTGNLLTQSGLRCFYEDKSEEQIKQYIFVKNLEFDYVDIVQVYCTLTDNINRRIGANILSFMLEQKDIYSKYDKLKSNYIGELYREKDKYKLKIDEQIKKQVDDMLYKKFIERFPETEMSMYINKGLHIAKNDFDMDEVREKRRREEIKKAMEREKELEKEQETKEIAARDAKDDGTILTNIVANTSPKIPQNIPASNQVVTPNVTPQVVAKVDNINSVNQVQNSNLDIFVTKENKNENINLNEINNDNKTHTLEEVKGASETEELEARIRNQEIEERRKQEEEVQRKIKEMDQKQAESEAEEEENRRKAELEEKAARDAEEERKASIGTKEEKKVKEKINEPEYEISETFERIKDPEKAKQNREVKIEKGADKPNQDYDIITNPIENEKNVATVSKEELKEKMDEFINGGVKQEDKDEIIKPVEEKEEIEEPKIANQPDENDPNKKVIILEEQPDGTRVEKVMTKSELDELLKGKQDKAKEITNEINPFTNGLEAPIITEQENLDSEGNKIPDIFSSKPKKELDLKRKVYIPTLEDLRKAKENPEPEEVEEKEEEQVREKTDEEKAMVPGMKKVKKEINDDRYECVTLSKKATRKPTYDDDGIIMEEFLPTGARRKVPPADTTDMSNQGRELARRVEEQKKKEAESKSSSGDTDEEIEASEVWE